MKKNDIKNIAKTIGSQNELIVFIRNNILDLSNYELMEVAELSNNLREQNAAYFTDEFLVEEIVRNLPNFDGIDEITILEPSVGVGNFVPYLIDKYKNKKKIKLILNDIDKDIIEVLKELLSKINVPSNIEIDFQNKDFLTQNFKDIDLIIGNPPYKKDKFNSYVSKRINNKTTDLFSFFIERSLQIAKYVSLIVPKYVLGAPMYSPTREYMLNFKIDRIIDFGEKGFKGVKIETISVNIDTLGKTNNVNVISHITKKSISQKGEYIFDELFPTWLIYRNKQFDEVANKLRFGVYDVFRDRQITNAKLSNNSKGRIQVIRSRNVINLGVRTLGDYDKYIDKEVLKDLAVNKFVNKNVVMVPNMTYYPRAAWLPKNSVVNGSVALLTPCNGEDISDKDLEYYSTDEFSNFYKICRNHASRTLNIDKTYVYYFGVLKTD